MSYQSGTSTDYADLLADLKTFVEAHGWTTLQNNADATVFRGPGGSSDEVYVAIQKYANVGADAYGWYLNGLTGWVPGLTFTTQPGALWSTTNYLAMPLWNDPIDYHFFVNDRRIVVVAQVSSTFQSCYLGYFTPYASPGEYPYPLCIGGSCAGVATPRFSGVATNNTAFANPIQTSGNFSSLNVLLPDGSWRAISNRTSIAGGEMLGDGVWPYKEALFGDSFINLTTDADGDYNLFPLYICRSSLVAPYPSDILGEFDGVRFVAGYSNGSFNTVTVGSDTWLVVGNVFRTDSMAYFTVKEA